MSRYFYVSTTNGWKGANSRGGWHTAEIWMPHLRDGLIVAKVGILVVAKREPNSKRGIPQNKSRKDGVFFEPENDRQLTSFHQQSTTNSPFKDYVCTPFLLKPPAKTEETAIRKITAKNTLLFRGTRRRREVGCAGQWVGDSDAGTKGTDEVRDVVVQKNAGKNVLGSIDRHGALPFLEGMCCSA